jgi:hypothetical protein
VRVQQLWHINSFCKKNKSQATLNHPHNNANVQLWYIVHYSFAKKPVHNSVNTMIMLYQSTFCNKTYFSGIFRHCMSEYKTQFPPIASTLRIIYGLGAMHSERDLLGLIIFVLSTVTV